MSRPPRPSDWKKTGAHSAPENGRWPWQPLELVTMTTRTWAGPAIDILALCFAAQEASNRDRETGRKTDRKTDRRTETDRSVLTPAWLQLRRFFWFDIFMDNLICRARHDGFVCSKQHRSWVGLCLCVSAAAWSSVWQVRWTWCRLIDNPVKDLIVNGAAYTDWSDVNTGFTIQTHFLCVVATTLCHLD